ncbi:MAG: rhodanese-like domain-containing protein [Saprospiraceae bacterium]|nr:rhodanese-like domain-containing protein [Saprospiraceae bacterium]MDW8228278.1 rhodanese-like domain-containing protein [Saprospiraceae bacterium]
MRFILFVALVNGVFWAACHSAKPFVSPTASVSVEEAYRLTQKGVLLIDVREPDEVADVAYRVKNYRNVPLSQLESRMKEIPRDQQVILACRSGNRSRRAYEQLAAQGYQNLANMEGGMLAWEARNLPVTRKE